jgi:hypothetical protein
VLKKPEGATRVTKLTKALWFFLSRKNVFTSGFLYPAGHGDERT